MGRFFLQLARVDDCQINKNIITMSILKKTSIFLLCSLSLSFTNAQPTGKTPLEIAANPFYSTLDKWNDFLESGGLNKSNSWHGISITEAGLNYDRESRRITTINFITISSTPVKNIRSAIGFYCGFRDSDWDKVVDGSYMSGTAENEKCQAVYVPYDNRYMMFNMKRKTD